VRRSMQELVAAVLSLMAMVLYSAHCYYASSLQCTIRSAEDEHMCSCAVREHMFC
jgi:hypothetical protein